MVHVYLAYPPCLNFKFNFSAFFVIAVALGKWGSCHIILYRYMYDAKFMSCLLEIHADTMRGRVAEWLVCWIQDKECQVWTLIRGHCITCMFLSQSTTRHMYWVCIKSQFTQNTTLFLILLFSRFLRELPNWKILNNSYLIQEKNNI